MIERLPEARGRGSAVVSVLAALLLLIPAGGYGKAGPGATVLVTLKSGVQASGELIQVRPSSIVILESSGKDGSFDLAAVSHVKILRRSKAARGALDGFLAGACLGLLAGSLAAEGEDPYHSSGPRLAALMRGGLVGLIGGGIIGASAGRDLDIRLDGAPPPTLRASVLKMSKYARVKGVA